MTRNAFGTVEKRGKSWRIRWVAGGQRHSKTVDGSRADAVRELARIQIETEGLERDATWGDYWEYRVEPSFELDGLAERTREDYRASWRRLQPYIAERWVSKTTPMLVEGVLAKVKPDGVRVHAARLLRKMCRMAMRDGALLRDPFAMVRVKAPERRQKRLLDVTEVTGWLEAIEGLKYEPVLLCELGGGLRHEEACALTWEDVEEWPYRGAVYAVLSVSKALVVTERGKMLKATKTAFSGREVVLGEPFASRLLALKGTGPLLPSGVVDNAKPEARYASPATMTHNWRTWCTRHGVAYVAPKNLRSTFATIHGEAGSPDSLVSGAMGHADGTTKARNYQQMTRRGGALIADNLTDWIAKAQEVPEMNPKPQVSGLSVTDL